MSNFDLFDPSLIELTPPYLSIIAQNASENILPGKSKSRYISSYDEFIAWRKEKLANAIVRQIYMNNHTTLIIVCLKQYLYIYIQPKTSPVTIKNYTNFNVYVNYNFYKK